MDKIKLYKHGYVYEKTHWLFGTKTYRVVRGVNKLSKEPFKYIKRNTPDFDSICIDFNVHVMSHIQDSTDRLL